MSETIEPMVSIEKPELFFGLVGAVGTDLALVRELLTDQLARVGYKTELVKVTDLLFAFDDSGELLQRTSGNEFDRIDTLMHAGNEVRRSTERRDIMAMLAISEIRDRRGKLNKALGVAEEESEKRAVPGTAYIIHSLKTPQEIQTLRDTYGRGLTIISAYSPQSARADALANRLCESAKESSPDDFQSNAWHLIQRDEKEGDAFGQNLRNTFPKADLFIDASCRQSVTNDIERFVEILFEFPFHSPSIDEYGMSFADIAALRSLDLARQVGAAIVTSGGSVTAVGCNEVPARGGGQYWPQDPDDKRDFQVGYDSSDRNKRDVVSEVVERLGRAELLSDNDSENFDELVEKLVDGDQPVLSGSKLLSVLEYGRSVHAEMAALSDAARRGISVEGATMYCTTFPCHLCARHIIASGIKRLVYVEPYPKSLAKGMYKDSMVVDPDSDTDTRVRFESFSGVAPRYYGFAFKSNIDRKVEKSNGTAKAGDVVKWNPAESSPRLRRFVTSYVFIEEDVMDAYLSRSLKKVKLNLQ